MTKALAQDLGGVVLLPCPFCGGQPKFGETNTGVPGMEDCGYAFVECCIVHAHSEESVEDAVEKWNTRAHSAEIAGALRDAERWQPIESAPRDGTYILVCNSHGAWIAKWKPVFQSGFRPSNPWASMMLNHDHIERPGRFDHPTHWRHLPPPKEASKNGV